MKMLLFVRIEVALGNELQMKRLILQFIDPLIKTLNYVVSSFRADNIIFTEHKKRIKGEERKKKSYKKVIS